MFLIIIVAFGGRPSGFDFSLVISSVVFFSYIINLFPLITFLCLMNPKNLENFFFLCFFFIKTSANIKLGSTVIGFFVFFLFFFLGDSPSLFMF
ncbi:hypothetical protein F4703DRAFT_1853873, partial [Phycomyces blakesleeanus]